MTEKQYTKNRLDMFRWLKNKVEETGAYVPVEQYKEETGKEPDKETYYETHRDSSVKGLIQILDEEIENHETWIKEYKGDDFSLFTFLEIAHENIKLLDNDLSAAQTMLISFECGASDYAGKKTNNASKEAGYEVRKAREKLEDVVWHLARAYKLLRIDEEDDVDEADE